MAWSNGRVNGRGQKNGVTDENILDQQNQQMTESLAGKVSHLKSLAFDIEQDTKYQNAYLGGMDGDFDSTQGLLSGSVNRLANMVGSGKNNRKLMCYIILGLVLVFFIGYYLISHLTAGSGSG